MITGHNLLKLNTPQLLSVDDIINLSRLYSEDRQEAMEMVNFLFAEAMKSSALTKRIISGKWNGFSQTILIEALAFFSWLAHDAPALI